MSAAKKPKIDTVREISPVQIAEITVDLGSGLLGRLHAHDLEDATIQEGRWQQFKAELYKSDFWRHYKELLDSPDWQKSEDGSKEAYKVVVEREIQRAWDKSGKGGKLLHMPQAERCKDSTSLGKLPGQNQLADISLGSQSSKFWDGKQKKLPGSQAVEGNAMGQNGGRLQRYLLTVEYLGTRFLGWQKQKHRPDLRTVQGTLEEAFEKFVGQPVVCSGSSRTDAGVHALANVCHVDVERVSKRKPGEVLPPHEPEVVKRALNHFLQRDGGDMTVVDVKSVSNHFHARFQARERTYHYRIYAGNLLLPIFERDRAWNVPEDLNVAAMQDASQVLVGNHDFSSFRAAGCQAKSPIKTLDELHVCEMPAWPSFPASSQRIRYSSNSGANEQEVEGNCGVRASEDISESDIDRTIVHHLASSRFQENSGTAQERNGIASLRTQVTPRCYVITARARSFLYHQVRLLVGTIKAVGCGALTIEDVRRILAAKSITATPAMAPACGLYLAEVKYDFTD